MSTQDNQREVAEPPKIERYIRPIKIEYDGWQHTVERDQGGNITIGPTRNHGGNRITVPADKIDALIDALFAVKDEPK